VAQTIIHLDTSFLIRAMAANSAEDRGLREWIAGGARLGMSCIGWAEFLCGPLDSRQLALAAAIVGEPEPFVLEDSVHAAELFNGSGRRRGSFIDCMIAATAIRSGASFATASHADFKRFPGLQLKPDRRSGSASS
jgi:predicted nucleic acid-binding protein